MKVVIAEFMDTGALDAFGVQTEVDYRPDLVEDRPALRAAVADAAALIVRNRTLVDADLIAAAPRLKVVGRLGVGLDNIDLEACRARGIAVRPALGANTVSVAEYVIAATLTLLRGAYGHSAETAAGAWPRASLIGGEAAGRVMGLYGFGEIARAVAARAAALEMTVAAFDPFLPPDDPAWSGVRRCSAEELLAGADVLSLHVPLTDATRNLIDADAIARMKQGAILVNTARGGIVDEPALATALRVGRLGGAALDVFASEPLTAQAGAVFEAVPNLILTPHVAGVTREANVRVSALTVANVKEVLGDG